MQEDTNISDLTVAEFRTLMQQCFDRDHAHDHGREMARLQGSAFGGPKITESQGLSWMQTRLNPFSRMRQP